MWARTKPEAALSQDPYGSLEGNHVGSVAVKILVSLALQIWLMDVQPSELNITSSEICFPAGADSLSQIPAALVQPTWSTGCCASVHLALRVQALKGSRELCFNSRSLVVLIQGPVQRRS